MGLQIGSGVLAHAMDPGGFITRAKEAPMPTDPGSAPTETSSAVQQARADVFRRRRSFLAMNPTGGTGVLSAAPTARKTLLGQG